MIEICLSIFFLNSTLLISQWHKEGQTSVSHQLVATPLPASQKKSTSTAFIRSKKENEQYRTTNHRHPYSNPECMLRREWLFLSGTFSVPKEA